jgi:hypothetical protein
VACVPRLCSTRPSNLLPLSSIVHFSPHVDTLTHSHSTRAGDRHHLDNSSCRAYHLHRGSPFAVSGSGITIRHHRHSFRTWGRQFPRSFFATYFSFVARCSPSHRTWPTLVHAQYLQFSWGIHIDYVGHACCCLDSLPAGWLDGIATTGTLDLTPRRRSSHVDGLAQRPSPPSQLRGFGCSLTLSIYAFWPFIGPHTAPGCLWSLIQGSPRPASRPIDLFFCCYKTGKPEEPELQRRRHALCKARPSCIPVEPQSPPQLLLVALPRFGSLP